jgi:sugar transferase EpsL
MQLILKRLLDLIVAVTALLVLWPVLLAVALAIRITMGKPIIFRQQRPGYKEKIFTIYKFRTMIEARDEDANLLPDKQRLTRTGKIIRSLSLDELPQLWNVIMGDLSLVGPRALLIQYLDRYSPAQHRRHDAKPGITGWAQINGRNAITWDDKFAYDLEYVDSWSLWFDIKIIFLTLWKVMKREGINQPGKATMEEFMGTQKNPDL